MIEAPNRTSALWRAALFAFAFSAAGQADQFGQGTEYNHLFRTPRPPILKRIDATRVLLARDAGAIPDDGKSDELAIQGLLDSLDGSTTPTRIVFEPGVYNLSVLPRKKLGARAASCLEMRRIANLDFDGAGATFLIDKPPARFLFMLRCRDAIVRDLTVDFKTPPFTQGVVLGARTEPLSFDLEFEKGFPSLEEPFFGSAMRRWLQIRDRGNPLRSKTGDRVHFNVERWEKTGDRQYRVFCNTMGIPTAEPGDPFVLTARVNVHTTFALFVCDNVTFLRVASHASSAAFVTGAGNEAPAFLGCVVRPRPGRWGVTCADGIYQGGNTIGPWVEGCVFESISDDVMNFRALQARVGEVLGEQDVWLHNASGALHSGDVLDFFDPTEGRVLGRAKIKIEEKDRKRFRVSLNKPVGGLRAGRDRHATHAYCYNRASESFVIRNNRIRFGRRYGSLIRAHHGVIEGNTYEGLTSDAICATNEPGNPEGLLPHRLVIRDNVIRDCGWEQKYLAWWPNSAAISVSTLNLPPGSGAPGLSQWREQHDIVIENNRIVDWQRAAIAVSGAGDVTIRGNRIEADAPLLALPDGENHEAIRIRNATDVEVAENTVRDSRPIGAAIAVEEESTREVELGNNGIVTPSKTIRPSDGAAN